MRVGIVGAGAVGGYFGGRLVEKGADVTFLVRKRRKEQLTKHGLIIHSSLGDAKLQISCLTKDEKAPPFNVIIIAVKAYHLHHAIETIKPYMTDQTVILPLLNGYRHLETLKDHFGCARVLGGFCFIESTLNSAGEVCHLGQVHRLVYGELNGEHTSRISQLEELFTGANLQAIHSRSIKTEMWNKYIHISALSGMTTLMRSNLGRIFSTSNGRELYLDLLREICLIANLQILPKPPKTPEEVMALVERSSPESTSSMYRDLVQGLPIETEHLHGSLVKWGQEANLSLPILTTIYTALSLYQSVDQ